ncbi:MAG: hypothetical protein ACF8XB_18700 [Planctomycetota bacterium JB042]
MSIRPFVLAVAVLLAGASVPLAAKDHEERAPSANDAKGRGKVFQSETAGGLRYEYFVPKSYDPERGAVLTMVFHGSNLDRRWAFLNHEAGKFRPNDIVVSPDGPTPNGSGGFNFRFADKDMRAVEGLHQELSNAFRVRRTLLYGHSQGAFFAFAFAGEHPDLVHGVLGQAGGVWIGTKAGPKHHEQAVAVLHGTADPVVSLASSAGAVKFFADAHYPKLHFRTLRDWNHWPSPPQAAQLLAWCDAMTDDDFRGVAASFDELLAVKEDADLVARYQVARRILDWGGGDAKVHAKAEEVVAEIDGLAARHVEAIEKSRGRNKGDKLEKKAWIGHVRLFLDQFRGIPAREAFAEEWERALKEHREKGKDAMEEYWRKRETKPAEAFVAGVDAISRGFLASEYADTELVEQLESWRKDARKLKISRSDQRYFDKTVPVFVEARKAGAEAFDDVD